MGDNTEQTEKTDVVKTDDRVNALEVYRNDSRNKCGDPADLETKTTANKIIISEKIPSLCRNFNSLPLFVYTSQPSDIDSIPQLSGMDCMPLTPGTHQSQGGGAYHNYNFHPLHHSHLIQSEQTKSLQELQNEVGALLEFRDLVIETFPDLKHKMASMSASGSTSNTLTGIASNSSLASRREWEPGIRIKRKVLHKDPTAHSAQTIVTSTGVVEMSSSLRSRSNSHSGKKEPKSGEGNGSVVQDSGFSTETSSSKEAHSASSTTGAMQVAVASTTRLLAAEADDELLNLLDVIHRKSNRLRDEVEHLQNYERDKVRVNTTGTNGNLLHSSSGSNLNHKAFNDHVERLNNDDIRSLRKERDRLLDKLAEMEAETLTGRIKATKMNDQVEHLVAVKKDLEEQLKLALSQKLELNSRFLELNKLTSKSSSSQSDSSSQRNFLSSATTVMSTTTAAPSSVLDESNVATTKSSHSRKQSPSATASAHTFQPVVVDFDRFSDSRNFYPFHHSNSSDIKQIVKADTKTLGRLDNLVSTPNRLSKVRVTDSKKIAAILLETNVIELQRHLLTLTVQNQVLLHKLDQAAKSKMFLIKRLDKSKEDVDDLRFQLEERNIELEGTKAQLRVLEAKMDFHSTTSTHETNRSSSTLIVGRDTPVLMATQISTPSMKAMIPLQMDEIQHHSSSTESAHDQAEREGRQLCTNGSGSTNTSHDSTRRTTKPSKIPLPGSKGYLAPKPPTGRPSQKTAGGCSSTTSTAAQKSLSRSTGSLYGKSLSSLSRPDSAQSNRKDSSIGTTSRSSSSSIPISAKTTTPSPHKILTNSPLPKLKRDSLTSRVRHFNSLSRVNNNSSNNISCNNNNHSNQLLSPSSSASATSISQNSSHSPLNNGNSTVNITSVLSTTNSSAIAATGTSPGTGTGSNFRAFKKDLNSSFTQGHFVRKQSSTPLPSGNSNVNIGRRFSSASMGRGNGGGSSTNNSSNVNNTTMHAPSTDQQQTDTDSGKIWLNRVSEPSNLWANHNWPKKCNADLITEFVNTKTANTLRPPPLFEISHISEWSTQKHVYDCDHTFGGQTGRYSQRTLKRAYSNNSEESVGKVWYYQPMVQESKDNFQVNKVDYSGSDNVGDEIFFDSIDNAGSNNDDNIYSMYSQEGGEEMAEMTSYERDNCSWSLDSFNT